MSWQEEKLKIAAARQKGTQWDLDLVQPYQPVSTSVKEPVSAPVLQKTDVSDAGHTGAYWVKEGGTYTQTHPGLMNRTEFYMWKRKQAGLSTVNVHPSEHAADQIAIERTFGMPSKDVPRPPVSAVEARESATESKAIAHRAAVGRSATVEAHEYIAHHGKHFGTEEAASLGAGLHNVYSDEYSVLEPKKGVNVVVDSGKDRMFVISDAPLGAEEKLEYARAVDKAGDVPNRVQFIERGEAPASVSSGGSGGGASVSGGVLIAAVAGIALIWYLMAGRR